MMNSFIQQEINKRTRWVYFSNYRWIAHVAYWTWVLVIGTLTRVAVPITPGVLLNHFVMSNIFIFIFYYLYCLFLIPYFFKRNKNLQFWILLTVSFLVLTISNVYFDKRYLRLSEYAGEGMDMGFWKNYLRIVSGYVFNFLFFTMLLFFMEKNEENSLFSELEEEKKEIELVKLDLLKTNISPDFILRSLKQLKKTAADEQPYTPQSIITFSELLRYRLYRGKQTQTPLQEEIAALQTFIEFITFNSQNNNLIAELEISGDVKDKFVVPLVLVNILEIFCKVIPENPAQLSLKLLIKEDLLMMTIIYDKKAEGQLFADLEQYGTDYSLLYGEMIDFTFDNCEDETCRIEMKMKLLSGKA
ncbi:histidine kinase [Pedobacter sp. L105]|uniref:histidine kinase n=1 Tax=Pedobacter sp. L105 TaxID=1641871 RepID=UPI00131A9E49|nr:histidine kinase [Pedobacter sp. L105]